MTNRQDIQPLDENSREQGSAAGSPGKGRRHDAKTGEFEERIRKAIVRAETELRNDPNDVK